MTTVIDADAFRDMLDERRRSERSFAVVDTRPRESYDGWRIADSIHYFHKPFHEFDRAEFEAETGLDPDDTVVTTCAKGKASLDLAKELTAAGYEDVVVVDDGMRGWSAVYDRTAVPLPDAGDGPLDVVQIQRRAKGCLGYLVVGGRESDDHRSPQMRPMAPIASPSPSTSHDTATSGGRRPPTTTRRSPPSSTRTSTLTTSQAAGRSPTSWGFPTSSRPRPPSATWRTSSTP